MILYNDIIFALQVAELLRHTECTLGNVDILVNNAGIMLYTMMKNLCEEDWHRQVDINCKVSIYMSTRSPDLCTCIDILTLVLLNTVYICFQADFRLNKKPLKFVAYFVVDAQLLK